MKKQPDRTTTEHQHYARARRKHQAIYLGDQAVCDGCGATFTIATVWAA